MECDGKISEWAEVHKLSSRSKKLIHTVEFLFSLQFHVSLLVIYFICLLSYFRHEAERLEQEAKGKLERQKIHDEAEAERSRRELLELQANSAAVESTGQAKAEAQSRAEASRIEGEAAVDQAKLKAMAMKIEAVSDKMLLINNNNCNFFH